MIYGVIVCRGHKQEEQVECMIDISLLVYFNGDISKLIAMEKEIFGPGIWWNTVMEFRLIESDK